VFVQFCCEEVDCVVFVGRKSQRSEKAVAAAAAMIRMLKSKLFGWRGKVSPSSTYSLHLHSALQS